MILEAVKFIKLREKDFNAIRDLALKGWYFAYSHIPKKELNKKVCEYYSNENLGGYLKNIKKGADFFLLAFNKKNLIGFVHLGFKKGEAELFRLYIDPKLIGMGLGKKLLFLGENFLKKNKARKYFTFVNKYNKTGLNFYLRNGFKRNPKNDRDDFKKMDLWYIEKKLM